MRSTLLVLVFLLIIMACDRGTSPPQQDPKPSATPATQPSTQTAARQDLTHGLLVVDWDAGVRSTLETMISERRAIFVAASSDQVRLLQECQNPDDDRVTGGAVYTFRGAPLREEHTKIDGATLDATYVGAWDVARLPGDTSRLNGDCTGATHVVRGIDVGAFELSSSSTSETKVQAPLGGGGVIGGSHTRSTSESSKSGDRAACAATDPPPANCRAAIRLHLQPLAR